MLRSAQGFTLLELMVVMSIAAILLGLALPEFRTMSLKSARSRGSMDLVSALNLARLEAIARNRSVALCPRDAFATATTPVCDLSGSARWAEGWIVYEAGGSGAIPAASALIAVFDAVGTVTASGEGNSFRVLGATAPLSFQANGRAAASRSFTFCETAGRLRDGRRVEVSISGRVSQQTLTAAETTSACAG